MMIIKSLQAALWIASVITQVAIINDSSNNKRLFSKLYKVLEHFFLPFSSKNEFVYPCKAAIVPKDIGDSPWIGMFNPSVNINLWLIFEG